MSHVEEFFLFLLYPVSETGFCFSAARFCDETEDAERYVQVAWCVHLTSEVERGLDLPATFMVPPGNENAPLPPEQCLLRSE
jgi:hypothetical protein